jgi:hypothetical protein
MVCLCKALTSDLSANREGTMRFLATFLVTAACAVCLVREAPAANPTPTPTATPVPTVKASPSRLLGFGFGAAQRSQVTPESAQTVPPQQDSLASVATHIKLRRLTVEDLKEIREAGPSPTLPPENTGAAEPSATQRQREEALAEYLDTVRPLRRQLLETDNLCRSCWAACSGSTHGSSLTTDIFGNYVVLDVVINNADLPSCRICASDCHSKLSGLAWDYNRARERAIAKGVFRHELDTGHLVFDNVKD